MKLKIDPDFKNLIPPLKPEEFKQLEDNILLEKRCREAILIWKNYIVDGHNRHAICGKHRIPFKVSRMNFASKEEALLWIAHHQLGRRNLSDAQRIELASRKVEMMKTDGPIKVRKAIADAAGLSEQTVHRYMKIVASGDAGMIEQLRHGEIKIGTAYGMMEATSRVVRKIEVRSKRFLGVIERVDRVCRVYWGMWEALEYDGVDVGIRGLERQLGWLMGF